MSLLMLIEQTKLKPTTLHYTSSLKTPEDLVSYLNWLNEKLNKVKVQTKTEFLNSLTLINVISSNTKPKLKQNYSNLA